MEKERGVSSTIFKFILQQQQQQQQQGRYKMNGIEEMWLDRHETNMGRTKGLHEEQKVTQEQGITVGFSLNHVQCNLAPSSDEALKREVQIAKKISGRRAIQKARRTTIKIGRK